MSVLWYRLASLGDVTEYLYHRPFRPVMAWRTLSPKRSRHRHRNRGRA